MITFNVPKLDVTLQINLFSVQGWDVDRHLLEIKDWRAKWAGKVLPIESDLGRKII